MSSLSESWLKRKRKPKFSFPETLAEELAKNFFQRVLRKEDEFSLLDREFPYSLF